MKTLFQPERVSEIKARLAKLQPTSERQWGKMNAPQMLAHTSMGVQMATGELKLPRVMIGRVLGPVIKSLALKDDEPMRKNSPTVPAIVVSDERDLEVERAKLLKLIDQLVAAGSNKCTTHPHSFFGKLTGEQWGILMYKHLDHHLRQFGV
ncbi:MAG: DUF1569 domain-containing protein [Gemmatimonadaceae bacterium]